MLKQAVSIRIGRSTAVSGCALGWLATILIGLTATAASYDINVYDYFFEPFQLNIQTGDTVAWTAYGFGHTILSDTRVFDSSRVWGNSIPVLREYKFTFHQPGDYPYYSLDYGGPDGAGMSAIIHVTGNPTNQIPTAPVNGTPADRATNQPIRVELRGSALADGDAGDLHAASQWTVRRAADNQIVYDSGEAIDNNGVSDSKTNYFLPSALLDYGTTYNWQVRYKDSCGAWSVYSAGTSFSTLPPTLKGIRQGGALVFSWPTNTSGFSLEYASNVTAGTWTSATPPPQIVAGQQVVTNLFADGLRIFRLSKP